jgi:hypothetical protein
MKYIVLLAIVLSCQIVALGQDKFSKLRTNKKIVTVDEPAAPYYSIQILALNSPPSNPEFFENLSEVKEYPCTDGYVRYCVGSYNSFSEANSNLVDIRSKGYSEAFVVNTQKFSLNSGHFSSGKNSKLVILPTKDYVVQLSAFRYPVYLSYFENVDDVYEYRMSDKIYRYTTKPYKGSEIEVVLAKMRGLGYTKAFIVEYDLYEPFIIE